MIWRVTDFRFPEKALAAQIGNVILIIPMRLEEGALIGARPVCEDRIGQGAPGT